jgi:hypothetical protein
MGMSWVLEYGRGPVEVPVTNVTELDSSIDQAIAKALDDRPYFVALHLLDDDEETGRVLSFGVGRETSFLAWGNQHAAGHGEPAYWYYGNQDSETPAGMNIPTAVARDAAREFVRTGERPTNVEWVEA